MPTIALAYEGRVEMLRAIFGGDDGAPKPSAEKVSLVRTLTDLIRPKKNREFKNG